MFTSFHVAAASIPEQDLLVSLISARFTPEADREHARTKTFATAMLPICAERVKPLALSRARERQLDRFLAEYKQERNRWKTSSRPNVQGMSN